MARIYGIFLTRTLTSTVAAALFALCYGCAVIAADEAVNPDVGRQAASVAQNDQAASVAQNDEDAQDADAQNDDDHSSSSPWPLELKEDGRTFLIYQPQVDKWENNRLEGRSAVSVRSDTSAQPNFGVIYFSARTETDANDRTVVVRDAQVSKADFPAVAGDDYLELLRSRFGTHSWRIAQERLQSDMDIDRVAQQSAQQPVRNDPPRILYSERPAVLVPIDGKPVLRPVENTGLLRVTNTRALILQDKALSRYFLYLSDRWMEANSLEGPWSPTTNSPPQLEQAKQIATQQGQVDLLQNAADKDDGAPIPTSLAVFVTTVPAELLQTDGSPQYAPIERTQLLYVTNSPNKLFLDLRTQNHYALISGRWFRTTTLSNGQWNYVPPSSLPADFAMIPAEHPTESVRAAVPGTPQAREAVIANSVPQMATVTRSAAQLNIAYDGDPVFQPMEGTPLQNAVNSPVPVIRVSADAFYALDNGVWFVAPSPYGPWTVASYVPPVIYSIPRSSPLHYVTYVRVYDATPEVVYVGYTPGYIGSYVSSGVVVYGTGWPYYPWIGSVWYGAPCTWGFGFSFFYSWWHPYPWYGGYPYHHHHYPAAARVSPHYHPWWGPWTPHAHPQAQRRGFVAGGGSHAMHAPTRGWHDVGRIYDRWDRKTVLGHAPNPWSAPSRPAARNGFAGPDSRWQNRGDSGHNQQRGITDQRNFDRGMRDTRQFRNQPESSARTPWRGPSMARPQNQAVPSAPQPRQSRPITGDNAGGTMGNRNLTPGARAQQSPQMPPAQWRQPGGPVAGDRSPQPRTNPPASANRFEPSAPAGAGRGMDRPREIVRDNRPSPSRQMGQPGTPMARTPANGTPPAQRAIPQSPRNNAPPMGRIERPAMASPSRGMERPTINARPSAQPSPARPAQGNGHSRGGGAGQWPGRNGHH